MESVTVPTRIGRKTITAENIADGIVPSTDPKDNGATGSTSSSSAPTEFANITGATYSAKNITGSSDWVEVTTAAAHGYSKGDKVTIYGLNNNLVNADGTFLVTEQVSDTVFRYSPSLNGFYSSVVSLTTSFSVTNRSRTTAIATLKLSTASHGLVAGAVITVTDVPDQTDYNGTFFIETVVGDTVTYKFESELSTSEATTASAGTIHAVTHKYAIIGDTWIDTSVTPNTYKVWNGLKWTDSSNIPDGVIIDDHMAPAAPTGLSATQNGYYDSSSGSPKIAVDLKWSAPTTNADGSTLRDLAGYKVYYKYTKGVDSTGNAGSGAADTTTTNTDGTLTGTFSYHPNIVQLPATVTFSTSAGTIQPMSVTVDGKTSGSVAWTISGLSDSQEVTMTWSTPSNGYGDITGTTGSTDVVSQHNNASGSFPYDIFGNTSITESTQPTAVDPVSGGASTAITSWQDGPDVPSTTSPSVVIKDFNTSSEIQFAVKAYDSSKKNYSVMSDALTVSTGIPAIVVNAPSKPSVEVRLGTATITWDGNDNAGDVPPPSLNYLEVHIGSTSGFTPSDSTYKGSISFAGSAGNFIVIDGLAYNSTWYAKFVAVSSTGSKTNPSAASDQFTITPLVDTDLIANTLTNWPFVGGVVNATALANGAVSARSLAQNAINSSNIANVITPGAISTGLIAANAIGADQIAAGSIVAGKLGADAVTANTISAGSIIAGKLAVNSIVADNISAGAITAAKLTADAIDGKVITGATVRTAASGARVVLDPNGIAAYNGTGTNTFRVDSSNGNVYIGGYATQGSLDATNTVVSGKISTGGAVADVNAAPTNTTINGGKITTGSITASNMSVLDTYIYRNSNYALGLSMGRNAVDNRADSAGISFETSNIANPTVGTSFGWVGAWNPGIIELGTDFGANYIDFNLSGSNTISYVSNYHYFTGPASFVGAVTFAAGTVDMNTRLNVNGFLRNYNTAIALLVGGSASAVDRGFQVDIGGAQVTVGNNNVGTTWTTSNLALQVYGKIAATGTITGASSRRWKVDLKELQPDFRLLDLNSYSFKYDIRKLYNQGEDAPELYSDTNIGIMAEDLAELGYKGVVDYDDDGIPSAVAYDRLAVLLLPIIRSMKTELDILKAKVGE